MSRSQYGQYSLRLGLFDERDSFDFEQPLFPVGAARETTDAVVCGQHPVAGDNDRDWVGSASAAHGP